MNAQPQHRLAPLNRPLSLDRDLGYMPVVSTEVTSPGKTLQHRLRNIVAGFGLTGGTYVHLGHTMCAQQIDRAVLPVRFVAASSLDWTLYMEEGALDLDPIVHRAGSEHMPYTWSTADYIKLGSGPHWLAERLQKRGVHGGVVLPVQDYAAGPAYVTMYTAFSDELEPLIASRGADLAYAAAGFHQVAKTELPPFRHSDVPAALTGRELDCLRLAALGRTVTETAESLNVTARTVEFHLKNAADKFGAPNKICAVAVAVSRGVISF